MAKITSKPTIEERWATDDFAPRVMSFDEYLEEKRKRDKRSEKAMADAPDYKVATGTRLCANCVQYGRAGYCDLYEFKTSPRYTCTDWEGGDRKEVSSTPTGVYGHGPGGAFGVSGLEESVKEYKPPTAVRNAAKRGLALRKQYGRGGLTNAEASEQGIGSGVQRAVNLANGDGLTFDTIKRMVAFFARHEKNKNTPPEKGNGQISWLLWGGDPGRAWAEGIVRREEEKTKAYAGNTGVMVAFAPTREEAQKLAQNWPDAERWEDLHITLCYMPYMPELPAHRAKILKAIDEFSKNAPTIRGKMNGYGRFIGVGENGTDAVWAHFDSPELPAFRQALIDAIKKTGVTYDPDYGFTPHMTLAYTDKNRTPVLPTDMPISFDKIRLHWRDDVVSFPLQGDKMVTAKEFVQETEKHLAGKHNQASHGGGGGYGFHKSGIEKRSGVRYAPPLANYGKTKKNSAYLGMKVRIGKKAPFGRFAMRGPTGTLLATSSDRDLLKQVAKDFKLILVGEKSSENTAKEFIRRTKAMRVTKTEDGVQYPATAYLVVEDESMPTTWHLRYRNEDGEVDNRLLGAAQAALTVGYRGNKYQGPQKAQAIAKLRKLRKSAGLETMKESGGFIVYKNKQGIIRWVAISSNAYRDRDGEIVSQKALEADVDRADKTGEYGPLRFWHMPGVDIGDTDFNGMHGRFLIESGTFRNSQIAEAVAQKAADYQLSIGFRHPQDEPKDGVFHNIRRFERSLVPAGRASNPFTSLSVKENYYMDKHKIKALKTLLGDDELAEDILQQADATQKSADGMGIAFKDYEEFPDLYDMTSDQLLDFALAMKEAEAEMEEDVEEEEEEEIAPPTTKAKPKPKMDEEDELPFEMKMGGFMDDFSKKMAGYDKKMDAMYKMLQQHTTMHGESKKESDDFLEIADAQTLRIAELEESIDSLQVALNKTVKELSSLRGDAPAGAIRATQRSDNITDDAPSVEVTHKNGQSSTDGFFDFVAGGIQ